MRQNVFTFNNKFYRQIFGTGMGNSLSPVIANLFMELFETQLVNTLPLYPLIDSWYRYVDDILVVVPHDFPIQDFLSQMNNLVNSIKFTSEVQNCEGIPFLDLFIIRKDEQLSFKIFRKPTACNQLLHAFSSHPLYIKQNIIFNSFLRTFNLVDPLFLDAEISLIFHQFLSLGYTQLFISKQYHRAKSRFYSGPNMTPYTHPQNAIVIPFAEPLLSLRYFIASIYNLHIVFSFPDKISNMLIFNNTTHTERSGGVYKVPCATCQNSYFGETIKTLHFRLEQHKAEIRRGNQSNAIFLHITQQHSIDWTGARFVFNSKSKNLNRLIESFFIKTSNNFNISSGFFDIDNTLVNFLKLIFKN